MKKTWLCLVVLIMASAYVAAQEAPGAPPYLLVVEAEVEKAAIGSWSKAVIAL